MVNGYSFDAVLMGANGVSVNVDCHIVPPIISGDTAAMRLRCSPPKGDFPTNPCSLSGRSGTLEVEIPMLWYSQLPLRTHGREFETAEIEILHVSSITQISKRAVSSNGILSFHLSPVRFLRKHIAAVLVRYSSVPSQAVELFRLNIAGLGEVTFAKKWAIAYDNEGTSGNRIHVGFYADVAMGQCDGRTVTEITEIFRESLSMLSILFRQAVSLLGWEEISESKHTVCWFDPLVARLAPDMGSDRNEDLTFPGEFLESAQVLVAHYFKADEKLKNRLRDLSVALAPHVELSDAQRFLSLFTGLERIVATTKASKAEKAKLAATNIELISLLKKAKEDVIDQQHSLADELSRRLDGFINTVASGGLSFGAQLKLFFDKYPILKINSGDLWPIQGSKDSLGCKEIRNRLAHDSHGELDHQLVSVATWHFSIFIERLVFVTLGVRVPNGIAPHSLLLANDWYDPTYWRTLRHDASENSS